MTTRQPPVVVGIAGRPTDAYILSWAADEAMRHHRELRIVHAYQLRPDHYGNRVGYFYAKGDDSPQPLVDARRIVDAAVEYAASRHGLTPTVDGTAEKGTTTHVLIEASKNASMLVVGSRPHRPLTVRTAPGLAARSHCPTVVVPVESPDESTRPTADAPVLVGVDSGPPSTPVLAFAFDHASRRGVPLRAVHCWQPDAAYTPEWLTEAPTAEHDRAAAVLSRALSGWSAKYPKVTIEERVSRCGPVHGLIEQSRDAGLLVVGAHGRHAALDRILGSVSQGVLHHATCPVAVVHPVRQ